MKTKKDFLTMLCLLTIASCGKDSGGSRAITENNPGLESEGMEGNYKAILRPYNNTLSGWVPNGITEIRIANGEIEIKSWLDDAANVVHMQNIHLGNECPTINADKNNDGFIDFNESITISKKILIPLDANLNSQDEGAGMYPKGNFNYFQKASIESLSRDLHSVDQNPADQVVKLTSNANLALVGKVIIVTGTAISRPLPESVSRINTLAPQASIPIACGVLKKI